MIEIDARKSAEALGNCSIVESLDPSKAVAHELHELHAHCWELPAASLYLLG
jgi:hypothetical protein